MASRVDEVLMADLKSCTHCFLSCSSEAKNVKDCLRSGSVDFILKACFTARRITKETTNEIICFYVLVRVSLKTIISIKESNG